MATLKWDAYKSGDYNAYITVHYTENVYVTYSTITIDKITYYNNYTASTDSQGRYVYWSGLKLVIKWNYNGNESSHTVIDGMEFRGDITEGGDNGVNYNSMNATTPQIPTGSSVSFVLSGTLSHGGNVNRENLTIGSSTGSSQPTKNVSTHNHDWISSITVAPTCTNTGTRTYTCTTCHNSYKESIPTLSHVWSGGFVTKPPTYEAVGTRTYTCRTCGGTRTEQIDKLPATIYIDNGSGFDGYGVYIDNGSSWDAYAVYIDDGEKFIAYC